MEKYTPIDCHYHDYLLDMATLRTYCAIVYQSPLGAVEQVDALIKDVRTVQGEEFAYLSSGEVIRLDRLVSVNGKERPGTGIDLGCLC